jgi:DNA-binding MarR family transcriptional regulator
VGEHLKTPSFLAFYSLLQVEARVMDIVGREFEATTGLPISWFEVLAVLSGEEGGAQRMNELADNLLISRGGATKLIARMEEAGLVERSTPPDDRRATLASVTPAGLAALEAAAPVQNELVEQHFGRFLADEDMQAMVRASLKVLDGLEAPCEFLREMLESSDGGAVA